MLGDRMEHLQTTIPPRLISGRREIIRGESMRITALNSRYGTRSRLRLVSVANASAHPQTDWSAFHSGGSLTGTTPGHRTHARQVNAA